MNFKKYYEAIEPQEINFPIFNNEGKRAGEVFGVVHHSLDNIYNYLSEQRADKATFDHLNSIKNLLPLGLLKNMEVGPKYQGQGLGGEAVEEFIGQCKSERCKYALLEADLSEQQKRGFDLSKFYLKMGFNIIGHAGRNPIMLKLI